MSVLGEEFAEYEKSARSVFVGNIPYEVTEERLKDIFSAVGPVVSFKLVYDRENGKPRGYGFCEFQDPHLARTAINNLNGYEVGGRSLRVDSACTEKTRMEMQTIMSTAAESSKSAYGEAVDPEEAPEKISKAVASLPPEQMFELMKQMMFCIRNNPDEAKEMLLKNPQLSYALLQALVVMRVVDVETAVGMLHDPMPRPPNIASQKSALAASRPFPQATFESPEQFQENRQAPPSTFDHSRTIREEPGPRFVGRDPRSRDPRAERDPRLDRGPDLSHRGLTPAIPPELVGADPARRQLLMQVLQLNDEQIAMLPAEQRASIMQLRKQLHKGATF